MSTEPFDLHRDDRMRDDYRALTREAPTENTHPDEETWVRLASDELPAHDRRRLVDHMLACAECAEVYRAVQAVHDGAAAFDPAAAPPTARAQDSSWTFTGLALAATVVFAVAAAIALRSGSSPPADPIATAPAAVRTTPATPPTPPGPPAPRAWAALSSAPAVRLPLSLALTVRGENAEREALLAEFGTAITPYREGRYEAAAAALAPLVAKRPDIPEFAFYLGVSRLLADDAAGALEPLGAARPSSVVGPDARWYEAVALERNGRRSDAELRLRQLCAAAGAYQARACAALESAK